MRPIRTGRLVPERALRVGILGLSHDHVWGNLAALAASERGRVVAASDPDPRLRERLASAHAGVEVHAAHDALLERTDLDGADALLAAARAAGQPLMVNWPTAWRPALRHGLALVASGAVGEPVQVSHRGGHAGPREYGCSPQFCEWLYDPARNGGGALVDYCGYGAILCRAMLGRPAAVTAVSARLRKDDLPAEDNAVVVLRYPRALAVLEGSWTQIGGEPGFAVIVYGDAGTLLVHQPRATREGQPVEPGRVQLVTRAGGEWIDPPPLPDDERDGPAYFLSRLRDGRPVEGLCAPEVGRDAQEVLAAALRSAQTRREITLP
jgi:predicted dehydrogenase